jgi:hypothetical protein
MLLLLKLVVVPALVAVVSLAGRRWGPRVAGVATSLPIVAGPALFFFAIEQGDAFAADASQAALVALIAVAASGLAYVRASVRTPWWTSLGACWASFVAVSFAMLALRWTAPAALLAALGSIALARALLPDVSPPLTALPPPAWDLPVRMLSAMVLVVTVTELADRLGPGLSGAFAPFPVALSVLLAFTHAQQGAGASIRFLRGFLAGMWSIAVFCFVTALTLIPLGRWTSFALAIVAVVPLQAAVLWWMELARVEPAP